MTAERPLNVAHRGASGSAPQNTLAAFRRAVELGADGVELDVHLSADGVPVVIHDFAVENTTDGSGRVADLPLAALQELDAGAWFDATFSGERIPTLEQVLDDAGPRLLVNVELKALDGVDRGLEAVVAAVVERRGVPERLLFSSFEPQALCRMQRLAPHIPRALLYGPAPLSILTFLRARRRRELKLAGVSPHWSLLRPAAVRRAHARGRRVTAWTVDEPQRMRRLVAWGVDAIITNYPDRLRKVLEAAR
ncbi:MAG: glycerophosphodiester phosphodiesterase [Anaerolineae bacterium]|nr:glycerophosphodiester phosphodiesterase [Anaerolineae bacterium]